MIITRSPLCRRKSDAAITDNLQKWLGKESMTNQNINEWYDCAMANGALGGKVIGAGGGGFLMFYAEDKVKLRHAMREQGLAEVRFRFDFEGTKVPNQ